MRTRVHTQVFTARTPCPNRVHSVPAGFPAWQLHFRRDIKVRSHLCSHLNAHLHHSPIQERRTGLLGNNGALAKMLAQIQNFESNKLKPTETRYQVTITTAWCP